MIQLYFDLTQVYKRKERVQSRRIDLENRPLTKYFMNMHFDKKEQCAKENISLQKLIYDYVVYITFHHTSESDDDDDECGECIQ